MVNFIKFKLHILIRLVWRVFNLPYKTIIDLPSSIRKNLPEHAQEIFLKAFNNAWDEYKEPDERRGNASYEETAFKVAWSV